MNIHSYTQQAMNSLPAGTPMILIDQPSLTKMKHTIRTLQAKVESLESDKTVRKLKKLRAERKQVRELLATGLGRTPDANLGTMAKDACTQLRNDVEAPAMKHMRAQRDALVQQVQRLQAEREDLAVVLGFSCHRPNRDELLQRARASYVIDSAWKEKEQWVAGMVKALEDELGFCPQAGKEDTAAHIEHIRDCMSSIPMLRKAVKLKTDATPSRIVGRAIFQLDLHKEHGEFIQELKREMGFGYAYSRKGMMKWVKNRREETDIIKRIRGGCHVPASLPMEELPRYLAEGLMPSNQLATLSAERKDICNALGLPSNASGIMLKERANTYNEVMVAARVMAQDIGNRIG